MISRETRPQPTVIVKFLHPCHLLVQSSPVPYVDPSTLVSHRSARNTCLLSCATNVPCRVLEQQAKNGDAIASINFCMGISLHSNQSTSSQDLYMTLEHTRATNEAKGWTAVGIGSEMKGAFIFLIYGDPSSKTPPTISVRSPDGHHQPRVLHLGKEELSRIVG